MRNPECMSAGTSTTAWARPDVVTGFARSQPNEALLEYANRHRRAWAATRVLDIGCGAGRNAVPLATHGFEVIGIDMSEPMLQAAAARDPLGRLCLVQAAMDELPVSSGSIDLIVAHGIWNLASSADEFRRALREAGRVASPDAALFVFTFSRNTLPAHARPVAGSEVVFTQLSGTPQVFLTRSQLISEVGEAGFEPDADLPICELNLPPPGAVRFGGAPVIFQAGFRKAGARP